MIHFFKVHSLLALFLVLPLLASSKVTWERDTVFNDGHAYAIMHKTGGITHTFSIRNLRDEELILVHFVNRYDAAGQSTGYYAVSFLNDAREGEMGNDINLAKKLAKEIVGNDLIKDGAVNHTGENRFLTLYPKQRDPGVNINTFTDHNGIANTIANGIAARNRNAPVSITGGQIFQDRKHIGDIKERSRAIEGTIYTIQQFTNWQHEVVAEATFYGVNSTSCKLATFRDGVVTRIVNLKSTSFPEQAVEVAALLSEQGYL